MKNKQFNIKRYIYTSNRSAIPFVCKQVNYGFVELRQELEYELPACYDINNSTSTTVPVTTASVVTTQNQTLTSNQTQV